jgi:hypothetical protein
LKICSRLMMLTICMVAAAAHAGAAGSVLATHPSASATLARNQTFWIRIAYQTDEAIRLWARPYSNGAPVESASSNASSTYTGAGEALGWFALAEPGEVDEVRIVAGGGEPYREWVLASYPVALSWTAAPAAIESTPQWVETLRAKEQARRDEEMRQRAAESTSVGEVSLFNGFMLIILIVALAGIGLPLRAARNWQGRWRIAAAAPTAVMGFVILRIVVDTARDPTSHNLWPFEIVMFGALSLIWIAALKAARRLLHVSTPNRT